MKIGPAYFMAVGVDDEGMPWNLVSNTGYKEAKTVAEDAWTHGSFSRVYVTDELMGGMHWINGKDTPEGEV